MDLAFLLADSGAAAFRLLSPGRGATVTGVAFAGAPFFPRNRCGERAILLRCRMLACGCGTGRRVFMADRLAVAFSPVSKGKQIGCCRVTELWTLLSGFMYSSECSLGAFHLYHAQPDWQPYRCYRYEYCTRTSLFGHEPG